MSTEQHAVFVIEGGISLDGAVEINGSKNAALCAIAASLLTDESVVLHNVPNISDVEDFNDILRSLGVVIKVNRESLSLKANNIQSTMISENLSIKLRASILVLGPLLARFGEVSCYMPGGDQIGSRPVDIHLNGLVKLGANLENFDNQISVTSSNLQGTRIVFDYPSVLGTINVLFAASLSEGCTIIENVATEPEVIFMIDMLNSMGAKISGSGSQTLTIQGVQELHGTEVSIIPDRIEAGTMMACIAATKGKGVVCNINLNHMVAIVEKFRDAGIEIKEDKVSLEIDASSGFLPVNIQSVPYPGFPTDLQAPIAVMLTQADGLSIVHERVFDNRLLYINEINNMGADMKIDKQKIYIEGPKKLSGTTLKALDVRAGAAAIVAGLIADGQTVISNINHIDRGYSTIDSQLKSLGAKIQRSDSGAQ
tara:strand:- start:6228 stop:7505 length:1278 start_codon:yes stop_codon:yes gene_type:complete